jgi:hypothetical protein
MPQDLDPTVIWPVDHAAVCTIWRSTREVFGNKLWHGDVDEVLDTDEYARYVAVVEERSGQSLFDCVMDAVAGLYPADPSEVFAALHTAFAGYGVELRFAPHHRHGDLLARAAAVKAGTPPPAAPRQHRLDETTVDGIWTAAEDYGYEDFRPDEWYDEDLLDDLQAVSEDEPLLITSRLVDGFTEDTDPSLFFRALHRYGRANGIDIRFAPHPEHGDVLARADAIDQAPDVRTGHTLSP